MAPRKPLSKKLRFEVFKRDKFTCQYCGKHAPDIVLHADHIKPVSKGGEDGMMNLITSCGDCNLGKGARQLSDDSVLAKQQRQLAELQERREQLEMLMEWQHGLGKLQDETVSKLTAFWGELTPGFFVNEAGIKDVTDWLRRFSVEELCEAMRKTTARYLETDDQGKLIGDSVNKAFAYIPRACGYERRIQKTPYMKDLYYIRAIMRRRFLYLNEWRALQVLEDAYKAGADLEDLKGMATRARNWSGFTNMLDEYMSDLEDDN